MIQKNFTTMFNELLLECLSKPDPMLHLLEWLCKQLMEAEVNESWEHAGANEQTLVLATEAGTGPEDGIRVWGLCTCLSQS